MMSAAWKPAEIRRWIKAFPTSASTVLVETDIGPGYLKPLGNREGPHILGCELVGTQLANWFGLSTLDFALIDVTSDDEIWLFDGKNAEPGKAFITRAEDAEPWGGSPKQLERLVNIFDLSRLVVFDTWTLNCDRHSVLRTGQTENFRINRDNVLLTSESEEGKLLLKAMDHTHCFSCGRALTKKIRFDATLKDDRLFGLFPEFRKFLTKEYVEAAVADLRKIDRQTVEQMISPVPTEWDIHRDVKDALADLILGRAQYVASTIVDKIWPQKSFTWPGSPETSHE
jgi:hypothetical protein